MMRSKPKLTRYRSNGTLIILCDRLVRDQASKVLQVVLKKIQDYAAQMVRMQYYRRWN